MSRHSINYKAFERVARFKVKNLGDLLNLRESEEKFEEIVNGEYVLDLWAKHLTTRYIDMAFETGNVYIVERALSAMKAYKPIDGVKAPDVVTYPFSKRFVENTYRSIDELLVQHREFLNDRVDVRGDNTFYSPLTWSCSKLNYTRVRFLLENRADPNGDDAFGLLVSWASSMETGETKNPELRRMVRLFIEKGVDDQHIVEGMYEIDDYDFMKFIIDEAKPDLNVLPAEDVIDPLLTIMSYGKNVDINILKLLIDNGADVNQYRNGSTPMSRAFMDRHFHADVIALLASHGALFDPTGKIYEDRHRASMNTGAFNFAEFLTKAVNNKSNLTDIHTVVKAALEQYPEYVEDSYKDRSTFSLVPDKETLELLLGHMEETEEYDLLTSLDTNRFNVMSYLYEKKLFDCIVFLTTKGIPLNGVYRIVGRNARGYHEIQAQVDDLVREWVPIGTLEPTISLERLIELYHDTRISKEHFAYILETKLDRSPMRLFKHFGIQASRVLNQYETIDAIIRRRHPIYGDDEETFDSDEEEDEAGSSEDDIEYDEAEEERIARMDKVEDTTDTFNAFHELMARLVRETNERRRRNKARDDNE